ncbi:MAG: hypothetical protein L0216_07990 [Planctomycetales bacterium]|nr:hypothetical protein [Planctomycetales bacterium]
MTAEGLLISAVRRRPVAAAVWTAALAAAPGLAAAGLFASPMAAPVAALGAGVGGALAGLSVGLVRASLDSTQARFFGTYAATVLARLAALASTAFVPLRDGSGSREALLLGLGSALVLGCLSEAAALAAGDRP